MSPLEMDDGLNGSIIGKTSSDVSNEQIKTANQPKMNLMSKLIDWAMAHPKSTKDSLFLNISSSGSAQVIITGLIRSGVFVEHYFDCHSCKYFTVDETKINIV